MIEMTFTVGDRMKKYYESVTQYKLSRRTPVIMRLDGRAFHTLTRACEKPFDIHLSDCMVNSAMAVMNDIMGAKFAYIQSDEISILITDYDRIETDAWFDYDIQKMASVSASMCSIIFNKYWNSANAVFDSRVFNVPKEEVVNYFVWRQEDWLRNSLQMLARSHFRQKDLEHKNQEKMHEMLHSIGVNWAGLPKKWKNGRCIYQKEGDGNRLNFASAKIFKENRNLFDKYLIMDGD